MNQWVQNVQKGFWRAGQLILILLVLGAPWAMPGIAQAEDALTTRPFVVIIPAKGTAQIAINGHCLNYGLPFPGASLLPVKLADDTIRTAILYNLEHGYYATDQLWEAQWAIWHFTDKVDITGDKHKLSTEIVTYAQSGKPTDLDANSLSLITALEQKKVTVTLDNFKNVSSPEYFGKGTLVITNLTNATLVIHIPYGMVFKDAKNTGVQDMGIFPADLPKDPTTNSMRGSACNQVVIKLPVKETSQIPVNGHCLNYGLPFPGPHLRSVKLATDVIRNTICYNQAQQYYNSRDLYQAQLAVWRQTDKLDQGAAYPLVNEIARYAESGVKPGDIGTDCVSLPDAVTQGLISATIDDFQNISDPPYFGKGTLVITNLSDKEQAICIPYGTVFKDDRNTGVQDMGIFVTDDPAQARAAPVLPTSGGQARWLPGVLLIVLGGGFVLSGLYLLRLKGQSA